jgi:hypothetical protein
VLLFGAENGSQGMERKKMMNGNDGIDDDFQPVHIHNFV